MRSRGTLTVVMAAVLAQPCLGAFPGGNGLIAFQTDRDGNREIYVMSPDGTGLTNISNHPEDDSEPHWSPDGARIVFRRGTANAAREIWVMNADGSGQTQLTNNGGEDEQASWSPDGTRIVFVSDRGGTKQLYVMNADGSGQVALTTDPSAEARQPAWSPDGTEIAYRRQAGGGPKEIWVLEADGTNPRQLAASGSEDEAPAWSPDGTHLVFESDREGGKEIWVMNADGSDQTRLTTDGESSVDPEWSPDGTQIVHTAYRETSQDLYVMNADGSDIRRVTTSDADDENPSWQPIVVADETGVFGKKLLLKDNDAKPEKRRLVVLLKDKAIDLGGGNASADDPTIHGGELRVVSAAGGFGTKYDLPDEAWAYKGKVGRNKGYKLKGAGPIAKVLVKAGKLIKIVGKGADLGHRLRTDPGPVHVALTLGGATYCGSFGGTPKFVAGKKYLAKKAAAPEECTLGPICGDEVREESDSCATLEGPPDGRAVDATTSYDGEPGIPDDEIEEETPGVRVARTRLEIEFADDVTVASVNAVLAALDGEILVMVRDAPLLVVRIPDPGSLAALEAVIAAAQAPGITISKGRFHDADVLPPDFDPVGSADLLIIDHHLGVRAPAAWNARHAVGTPPRLVLGDLFGNGEPNGDVAATYADLNDFFRTRPDDHGYHVLGIAVATFAGNGFCSATGPLQPAVARGCVTGMMPAGVPVRVADDRDNVTVTSLNMRIVHRATGAARVVLNTSLNSCCEGTCGNIVNAGIAARKWAALVRAAGLESTMLHVTSAGNIDLANTNSCKDPADFDALTNSEYTAAALHPAIPDMAGGVVPNLTNTLVVENVRNHGAPDFAPRCLSAGSKRPGTISAIGTNVFSHTDPNTSAGDKSGTSMATPQVAGLAAYLWALDPTMSVDELRGLLLHTAVPVTVDSGTSGCDPLDTQPQAIIDAYAAVLALDDDVLPTPASAPVRHAIVDEDGSGTFDETDLQAFLTQYFDGYVNAQNPGTPVAPTGPDWSRWDLNGDGLTGGLDRVPFDLDRTDSTQYGASGFTQITQMIEGLALPFDETALTDLEILCYYAYSGLWGGNDDTRTQLLGTELCSRYQIAASFPTSVTPGVPAPLVVSLGERTATGTQPVEGARIEAVAAGGTVTPGTGLTDPQGEFTAQGEVIAGSPTIDIEVRALDAPGGFVLAQTSISAQSTGPVFDDQCSVFLDVGRQPGRTARVGPLVVEDTEGPVHLRGSIEAGTVELQADWDIDNLPWVYDGGMELIWNDVIEITPVGCTSCVADMRHRMRFTFASTVDVRSKPERSQGWFELDSDGFNPGGTFGFNERNLGGTRPERVQEVVYERFASERFALRVRTRLYTFTGFGGELVDTLVDGSATIEWLGIEEVLDFAGNSIPFSYRSLCGGRAGSSNTTTTSTTTSTSTTSISTTTTSSTTSTLATTTTATTVTSSTTTSSTTTTSTTLPGGGGAFYRLYDATGADAPAVTSADRLRTETIDLGAVVHLLVPASVDGSVVAEPDAYQTCYAHPGAPFAGTAQVTNAYGGQTLTMGDPATLCVIETTTLAPTDEFNCYGVSGTAIAQPVSLSDRFSTETVTVTDPALLCLPTSIDGAGIVNPNAGLVCYDTATTAAAVGPVAVDNRFGTDMLDVGVPAGVCLPSTLSSVVPVP